MLRIDRDLPIPRGRGGRGSDSIAVQMPWASLKVGDSVLIPKALCDSYRNPQGTITGCAFNRGMRVKVRWQTEGIRIWRTA